MSRASSGLAVLAAALVVTLAIAPALAQPNGFVVGGAFGTDAGTPARVKVYNGGSALLEIEPFPGFTGGARVALGDLDGDGVNEVIVGAGPGGGPHVIAYKIIPGDPPTATPVASFYAFDPAFTGGVYVAGGNFDPSNDPPPDSLDGPRVRDEIVVGAGEGGGPHVRIFKNLTTGDPTNTAIDLDVANPIVSFFPYAEGFTGGVRVAAGDLNNDGVDELITGAGPGGGPHVLAFGNLSAGGVWGGLDLASPVASFFAFDPAFAGGVYVTTVDWDGNGRLDIAAGAGEGGGPHVVIIGNTGVDSGFAFDTATPIGSFFAFEQAGFTGGVRVGRAWFAPPVVLYVVSGPGGSGFAKAVLRRGTSQEAQDYFYGLSPFDLLPFGVFVSPSTASRGPAIIMSVDKSRWPR